MRITPENKYLYKPCSWVGTGCAYEDIIKKDFSSIPLPEGLQNNGYLSLEDENKFIRKYLPIKKKVYYSRANRIRLKDFLTTNESQCCVCVYGHFIYVNGKDYWSFFENEDDWVVCVWYIDNSSIERIKKNHNL